MAQRQTDIENPDSWVKYNGKLCRDCDAGCCQLPVEVGKTDLVRMEYLDPFDLDENMKRIAKRLKKEGVIEHFYNKRELFTLTRMANGDCLFLDPRNRRCTIYHKRPDTCRNHPGVGPRSGYCAYNTITPQRV